MKIQNRILHIVIAIGLILVAVLLIWLDKYGPKAIALISGFAMLVYGIRCLVAFFTKFRYMVGGRSQLYIGILSMDMGLMVISAFDGSTYLILMYLLGIRAVSGVIDLVRAMESKKNGAPWKMKLVSGIISLATVVLGIVFFRDPTTVVGIYCIGLFISAVEHIITAFRKTKVVTIA